MTVTGADVVNTAKTYLGVPYSWGGASPAGFDCSGFTDYVYGRLGINIGRTTVDQSQVGYPVQVGPANNPTLYAQPGDLILFGLNNPSLDHQHVGIYVGDGMMINSPNSTSTVRYDNVATWGPDEPISGIRRVTTGGNSTAGATLTSADSGGSGSDGDGERCLLKSPSLNLGVGHLGGNCLLGTAQARALLGSLIIIGGGLLMVGGVMIVVGSGKQAQLVGALTRLPRGAVKPPAPARSPDNGPLTSQDKEDDLNRRMFEKRQAYESPGIERRGRNALARDRYARSRAPRTDTMPDGSEETF